MAADRTIEERAPAEGEFPESRFETVTRDRRGLTVLALCAVLVAATLARLFAAAETSTPWVLVDELVYSELAKEFAGSGDFLVRDAPSGFKSLLYPAVISPAWLFDSIGTAYRVAKGLNVILSLGGLLLVWVWARWLVPSWAALVAVLLSAAHVSLVYTGALMTENGFFPAFLLACYATSRLVERPTLWRQALVVGAIVLACGMRIQGLALAAVVPTAIVLKLLFDLRARPGEARRLLSGLKGYVPLAAAVVLAAGAYLAYQAQQEGPLRNALGAYRGVVEVDYGVREVGTWLLRHYGELALTVGVFPFAALLVLVGLGGRGRLARERDRAFVATALAAVFWLVLQTAAYASRFSFRVEERYMFHVVPILFLALAVWLAARMPRPIPETAVAAAAPLALIFALPLPSLLNISILSDTFGFIPLLRLSQLVNGGSATVDMLAWMAAAAAGLAFAFAPRSLGRALIPAAILAFLSASSYSAVGAIRDFSRSTLELVAPAQPDWIDARLGDERAAFVYGVEADLFLEAKRMWQTEFWNRTVSTVYAIGPPEPAVLPETKVVVDQATGRLLPDSRRPLSDVRYVVSDARLDVVGRTIAEQPPFALRRVVPPLRVASQLSGLHADGWMGGDAAYTRYVGREGVPVRVVVSRRAWRGPDVPGKVSLEIGPLSGDGANLAGVTARRVWTVHSGSERAFVFHAPRASFRVQVHVEPTFSPADFGQVDPRQLGAQVSFTYLD